MIRIFELSNYKDVDDTVKSIVLEYEQLKVSGNDKEAHALLDKNKQKLKPYFINANSFNKIEKGIDDLSKQILYTQKTILSVEEPDATEYELRENSEWLQEY